MPFATVRLKPGVQAETTFTLNEAAISTSNLIRFQNGLPQKLGGWSRWMPAAITSVPRALHPWADLNAVNRLAIGATTSLQVVTGGLSTTLTPQNIISNNAVNFSTTIGSNIVTIVDVGSNESVLDTVVINVPVSIGGIVLFGAYQIYNVQSINQYQILAAANATSSVSNAGVVPSLTTVASSTAITVTLPNHGYSISSTFSSPFPTTIAGVTIVGLYQVSSVTDSSHFVINAITQATSTLTVFINSGNANLIYWVTQIPPLAGTGYGNLGYGLGGYGTGIAPPTHVGTPIAAVDYTLDNWGKILIANPENGGIYAWAPDSGYRSMQLIANAPLANTGMFIAMPQQQIVVYGAAVFGISDPLLVAFCDVANFNTWTAAANNQAGTFRIPRGSKIVGGLQAPQQGLLWTDLAIWSMMYIGGTLVYGFNEIASGCGLIAKKASVVLGSSVYWMSQKGFYVYSNGQITQLPCSVWDVVFQNLSSVNTFKIRSAANSQFNEVAWHFPSATGLGENDTYVKFNTVSNVWDYGIMARSAWTNQSVLGSPLAASPTGYIYQHETGNDADGTALTASFDTGYFMLSDGEEKVFVDLIIPDFKFGQFGAQPNAQVNITVNVSDYPNVPGSSYGPYTVSTGTPIVPIRARGRYFSLNIASADVGTFWRLGGVKFRYALDGRV